MTLKCHSCHFPHPHCWTHHYSGFVLDRHFHYKGRNQAWEEFWWSGCHQGGILGLLVHHSWLDYILRKLLHCLHKPQVYSSRRQSRVREEAGVWVIKWNVVWVSMLNGIEGSLCWIDREEASGKFCSEINFKPSILSDYVCFHLEFCNHSTSIQSRFSISC